MDSSEQAEVIVKRDYGLRIFLKLLGTLLASGFGFCGGFLAVAAYYNKWVVPQWVKEYPHDGQLGLAVFVHAINGGAIGAVIVFIIGIFWTVRTSLKPKSS